MDEQVEKMMKAACDFQARSLKARGLAREEYRKKEGSKENSLRFLLDGLMAHVALSLEGVLPVTSEEISYQIGVSTSIFRTHFIITDLVLDGDLLEAATLVRRQLECLARLHEIDSRPLNKIVGKTPNISNALDGEARKIYGQLSEIAHFSKARVSELLGVLERGEAIGPHLLPTYNNQSHACGDLEHFIAISFLGWFLPKRAKWFASNDYSEHTEMFKTVFLLAIDCGAIRFPEDT